MFFIDDQVYFRRKEEHYREEVVIYKHNAIKHKLWSETACTRHTPHARTQLSDKQLTRSQTLNFPAKPYNPPLSPCYLLRTRACYRCHKYILAKTSEENKQGSEHVTMDSLTHFRSRKAVRKHRCVYLSALKVYT